MKLETNLEEGLKVEDKIPFVDLKGQYYLIQEELKEELEKVLNNSDFILGSAVSEFEEAFARFCDSKYCVGVASGTDALHLALKVLDIGKGDEVITAANTFVATVLAISYVGARPVLVDIDPETYNIDLDKIEAKITPNTKAIIPVHLYGKSVDMGRLLTIADKYDLKVVEDACQAHGAVWKRKKAGSFGILGCFSFYPGKNLGAYGDGGAIVTSDKELYETLKMMRNYGSPRKYYHDFVGYNSRLDTMQAAILKVKLRYLDIWNKKRLDNAKYYNKKLNGIGDLTLPVINDDAGHVFHLYVVRTEKRDGLLKFLNKNGIQCGIHYPVPIYSLKAYQNLCLSGKDFPITEQLAKEILSLPMFPELAEEQIGRAADIIKIFYNRGNHG